MMIYFHAVGVRLAVSVWFLLVLQLQLCRCWGREAGSRKWPEHFPDHSCEGALPWAWQKDYDGGRRDTQLQRKGSSVSVLHQ